MDDSVKKVHSITSIIEIRTAIPIPYLYSKPPVVELGDDLIIQVSRTFSRRTDFSSVLLLILS